MRREKAIEIFGHHYEVETDRIVERLGPVSHPEFEMSYPDLDSAVARLAALERRHRDSAAKHARWIERLLRKPSSRIDLWRARNGLHKRADKILENAARLRAELDAINDRLSRPIPGAEVLEPLPEEIRLPVVLDIGTPYWRLQLHSHECRFELTRHEILHRNIYRAYEGPFDYRISYSGADRRGFTYQREDFSNPEVDTGIVSVFCFLDEAAALERLESMARHVAESAAEIAAQAAARRGRSAGISKNTA